MSYLLYGYHLADSAAGRGTIETYHNYLDRILPTWLGVTAEGTIEQTYSSQDFLFLTGIRDCSEIIPLVQNHQLDSRVSNLLVSNRNAQRQAINSFLNYLREQGFPEINLDLEGVKIENRDNYTDFIERLADSLHQQELRLSLSIPAKTENRRDSTWSGAYNYSRLGKIADMILIMAYDYHWAGGSPGPIAPLTWVQDVIDFALMEVPLEKICLGIALYGYDWIIDDNRAARPLSYQQIAELTGEHGIEIEWDQESRSPYLRYILQNEEHEIWFENQESIRSKIKLVQEFQLAGAAFWRLGLEDRNVWGVVR